MQLLTIHTHRSTTALHIIDAQSTHRVGTRHRSRPYASLYRVGVGMQEPALSRPARGVADACMHALKCIPICQWRRDMAIRGRMDGQLGVNPCVYKWGDLCAEAATLFHKRQQQRRRHQHGCFAGSNVLKMSRNVGARRSIHPCAHPIQRHRPSNIWRSVRRARPCRSPREGWQRRRLGLLGARQRGEQNIALGTGVL